MEIVLVGDRSFSGHVIRRALEQLDVVGVITPTIKRSLQLGYEPIGHTLTDLDVPLIQTDDINGQDVVAIVQDWNPDLCLCTSWTQIVDDELLSVPEHGWLGMHPSDLPRGRGGAAVNWSLIRGSTTVTLSLFEFTGGIDEGQIIEQATVDIQPRDTVKTVFDKLAVAGSNLVSHLADSPSINGRQQDLSAATYRPSRTPDDGLIDWGRPPSAQHDWIRALSQPYPGAFTFVHGERLVIWSGEPREETQTATPPGEILRIIQGEGVDVCTGEGTVRLHRVQVGDEPAMWADTWADRADITSGDSLGRPADFPEWLYTGIRDADGGYDFMTNVPVNGSGAISAVMCSHATTRTVEVRATLADQRICTETVTVDGWASVRVPYTVSDPGTRTLTVTFHEDGTEIDRRYLRTYTPGPSE